MLLRSGLCVYVVIAHLVAAERVNSEEFLWNSKSGTVSSSGGSGCSQCHSHRLLVR